MVKTYFDLIRKHILKDRLANTLKSIGCTELTVK